MTPELLIIPMFDHLERLAISTIPFKKGKDTPIWRNHFRTVSEFILVLRPKVIDLGVWNGYVDRSEVGDHRKWYPQQDRDIYQTIAHCTCEEKYPIPIREYYVSWISRVARERWQTAKTFSDLKATTEYEWFPIVKGKYPLKDLLEDPKRIEKILVINRF